MTPPSVRFHVKLPFHLAGAFEGKFSETKVADHFLEMIQKWRALLLSHQSPWLASLITSKQSCLRGSGTQDSGQLPWFWHRIIPESFIVQTKRHNKRGCAVLS